MPDDQLTPEEIAKLRLLIPVADAVREEAEYNAAVRLLLKRWKGVVIAAAAVVAAIIFLWNHAQAGLRAFLGIE